ncbi:bacteriohemerythrin [Methylomonas sp. LL1]|uniref:bacteriohemerythrin n=1 Tax=Methylomonas sp. LL1 TaxID=2785785 RepID=UPI0018C3BF69|nr:bacteriohemerythrin [Methylomonas sp. LL1]QPK63844.1 bacteriohemerythrin [Methylomonas sp. LL1]
MSKFIWQNHYQIGNATVDAQHRHLFDLANQVMEAAETDELTRLIMLFYQHIREHFQSEENLMKQHGYPCYRVHVENHNLMLNRLIEISKTIQENRWDPADIDTFVSDWVLRHILEVDTLLGEFIAKRSQAIIA